MNRDQDVRRADRNKWLADLGRALQEAARLTTLLLALGDDRHGPDRRVEILLRSRILAARDEVAVLQRILSFRAFELKSGPIRTWWGRSDGEDFDQTP